MTDDLSLVPPGRLGVLLTEHRTRRGLTIDELQLETRLPFSADELRRIEQGELPLNDNQINRLLQAYGAGAGPVVPERTDLVVDIEAGAMWAGRRTKVLPENPDLDDILGRYLALLYLMRGLEPGRELSLRGDDLGVLSAALERSITEIEGRLFELMLPDQVLPWFRRVRHRLAVPAAGIMVGLTTVGGLVFVQFPKGDRPVESAVAPGGGRAPVAAAAATELGATEASAAVVSGEAELIAPSVISRPAVGADALAYELGDPSSVGAAAEMLIAYPFREALPDWNIEYVGPREGYRGNTNTVTRTVTVHVSAADTPETVAGVLAHELGHALDVLYLDDDIRREWLDLRGIDAGWWPESGAGDFHLGAGDFAEAVALLIADSPSDADHGHFTPAQLDFVRSVIPLT